jgi:hypothetical protein
MSYAVERYLIEKYYIILSKVKKPVVLFNIT